MQRCFNRTLQKEMKICVKRYNMRGAGADVRHALAKQSHIYDLSNLRVPRAEILCLQQDCICTHGKSGCRFRMNTVQIIHANTNHNRKGTCEKVWLNLECGTPYASCVQVACDTKNLKDIWRIETNRISVSCCQRESIPLYLKSSNDYISYKLNSSKCVSL